MDKSSIKPGEQYGYRVAPRELGSDLHRIEVLDQVRPGRWKVKFLDDPNPGLVDYVRSGHIVVAWADREEVLADERRKIRLLDACRENWKLSRDKPVAQAVQYVLEASGEHAAWVRDVGRHGGHTEMPEEVFHRISSRGKLKGKLKSIDREGFVDRHGTAHLTLQGAVKLAKAYATAEPEGVLRSVTASERRLEAESSQQKLPQEYVEADRPARAIVREWVEAAYDPGTEASMEQVRDRLDGVLAQLWGKVGDLDLAQRQEIGRLRELLAEASAELRRHGAADAAKRIERSLSKATKPLPTSKQGAPNVTAAGPVMESSS
jgi:hypothetical protein